MNETILKVHEVEKQFATVKAVDRLSFEIRPGEIFALLGPNGAGKTTMVRMLLNIIKPDRGSIRYDGPHSAKSAPSGIGYLPEERGLYQDIPVLKTLVYFGVIRGMEKREAERRAIHWLDRFDLSDRGFDKIQALSKGNQQKVQFIASILHSPSFVVLDEPFSGLDPLNQDLFSNIIRELCQDGTTILLSAHQMQLVERLADRIFLINRGREILYGTLEEIRERSAAGNKIMVQCDGVADPSKLRKLSSVQKIELQNDSSMSVYIHPGSGYNEVLQTLGMFYSIRSVRSEHMSLHDIFIQAIGNGK